MMRPFTILICTAFMALGASSRLRLAQNDSLVAGDSFYKVVITADAFPLARRGGLPNNLWTNAGVNLGAGIPVRTTIYTNMGVGSTHTAINAALSACPSNQVVQVTNGTFDFSGNRIEITSNGKTLRGTADASGMPTTFFTNCDLRIGSDLGPAENWATEITSLNILSGLTEGSTSIVCLASLDTDFAVGDVFMIDQTDDGTLVKDCSVDWAHRPNRAYCQVLRITGKDLATLTFEPPLLGTYWDVALRDPEAVGWSVSTGGTVLQSGIENIDVDINEVGNGLVIGRASSCWAKNLRMTGWPTSGGLSAIRIMWATGITVENCIFHDGPTASSSAYAVYPSPATFCLIQNNIFTNVGLGIPLINAVGSVIAYNVGLPPYPYDPSTWLAEYFFPHGGHNHHVLWEGNWIPNIFFDQVFNGNNSDCGFIRNRIIGYASGKTSDTTPVQLEAETDNITVLGNCLGYTGYHTTLSSTNSQVAAYIYGIQSSCTGTILTNNWNVVSNGIPAGETLNGAMTRDSYAFNSKPSRFGALAWPPFGPVASYTNTVSYTNLPAGYRLANGAWP